MMLHDVGEGILFLCFYVRCSEINANDQTVLDLAVLVSQTETFELVTEAAYKRHCKVGNWNEKMNMGQC